MILRRAAVALIGLMVAINLAILASGNMHAGRHHPTFVNALSWLFALAFVALIGVGFVAVKRRRAIRLG